MMKIGIVTFHKAYNCGAMLQAYALMQAVRSLGYEVYFPSCNSVGLVGRWRSVGCCGSGLMSIARRVYRWLRLNISSIGFEEVKRFRYWWFRRKYLPELVISVDQIGKGFDGLIFGSDQIWNLCRTKDSGVDDSAYFLAENISEDIPKIGYAVSIGDGTCKERERVALAIHRMKAVSFREPFKKEMFGCCEDNSRFATVLDPTLLIDSENYKKMIAGKRSMTGDYILIYNATWETKCVRDVAINIEEKLSVPCVKLMGYGFGIFDLQRRERIAFGPINFLELINNAKAVVANSFHGTVFAIIFNKPFLSLVESRGANSRQENLLEELGLEDRLVVGCVQEAELELLTKPLPETVFKRLGELRQESMEWLKRSLCASL